MKLIFTTLLLLAMTGFQVVYGQENTYYGTVTDGELNEPFIGVTVVVKGTTRGVITDIDGYYEILASAGDTLEFSYLGYEGYTLVLGAQLQNDVTLATDAELLDEVVVVGYGTVKKSDLTGSVSKIKSDELTKVPAPNAIESLQGKVAGLQILNASGEPGSEPIVRLRGITTLNDNNPIAVIDGVITDINAVSMLNPNDIESVEVLKDASASAIYGSRGAAGVIIITTKRGKTGKTNIQISAEQSIASVASTIDVMNREEFTSYINVIEPGTFNNIDVLPDTDWQDEIFRNNSSITNINLSLNGASDQYNYYFGAGYYNEEGIIPKSGLERFTFKLNSGFNVTEWLDIGLDLNTEIREKENPPGVVATALRAWPVDQPYQEDGKTFAEVNGGNPVAAIEYSNSNTKSMRGLGNLYGEIALLKNFRFKSSLQFDLTYGHTRSFVPEYFVGPLQQNEINDLSVSRGTGSSLIFENTLSYYRDFGKHTVNAVAGFTSQDIRSEYLSGSTQGLVREDPLFWYLDAGQDDFDRAGNNLVRSTLLSYLGRVNYSYDSRYLFTVSFRRDGSSKFGPNNRYGNFPSFAVGWNISNEGFWSPDSPLDRLKFRASWGIIGNEKINGNAQYSLIVPGIDAVFGDDEKINPGVTYSGGGNPDLKWEETTQFNIGLDMGFWQDQLTIELDYYVKQTDDILVPLEPIGYTGIGAFQSIVFNAANVRNSGFEWNVSYRNQSGDFFYQVGVLGTTIKNEVTDIGQGFGADSLLVGGDLGNGQQVARSSVGNPIGYFYGYEMIGIFQNQTEVEQSATLFGQAPGDLKYRDINGDGVLNAADRTFIGSSIPDLIYGFSLQFGWKNIALSADFQGQAGNDIYNGKQAIRFTTLNYEDKYNNYWTGEGSTNTTPRPTLGGNNFIPSSYYVEDGSFLRLRTLTLTYTLPQTVLDKMRMSSASVYLRGTNLFTATRFTGYSPEIGASSAVNGVIDLGIYPITRVFSVGLNLNF